MIVRQHTRIYGGTDARKTTLRNGTPSQLRYNDKSLFSGSTALDPVELSPFLLLNMREPRCRFAGVPGCGYSVGPRRLEFFLV